MRRREILDLGFQRLALPMGSPKGEELLLKCLHKQETVPLWTESLL